MYIQYIGNFFKAFIWLLQNFRDFFFGNLNELNELFIDWFQIKDWFEKEKEKYLGSLDQEQLSSDNVKRLHEEFLIFSEKAIVSYGTLSSFLKHQMYS